MVCRLGDGAGERLAAIDADCNRPPWRASQFEQEFKNSFSNVFGARTGGQLVGFAVFHQAVDEAHMVTFGVAPEWRRRGVGANLLLESTRDLSRRAVRVVTLEVRAGNTAARSMYELFGFQEVGLRAKYYEDGEDGLILRVDLEAALQGR